MKKTLVKSLALAFVGSLLMTGVASAISFSNTQDFNYYPWTDSTGVTKDYWYILESGSKFVGSYSHNLNFDPAAGKINNASITLSYARATTGGDEGEMWFLYGGSSVMLGHLTGPANVWSTETFDLSPVISGLKFADLNPWTIAFKFKEGTLGSDTFKLDSSILSGDYTAAPVPEPATMLLLGTGLAGLAGARKRKTKK